MEWAAARRLGLWLLVIFLASAGGATLHIALIDPTVSGPIETFVSLLLLLSAAAIYMDRLR